MEMMQMNIRQKIRKYCPWCKYEAEIEKISIKEMGKDYINSIGTHTAIVEYLSCSPQHHRYVDGRFDIDNLYYSSNKSASQINVPSEKPSVVNISYINYGEQRSKKSLNLLDILCAGCLVFLVMIFPPLAIIPTLYFVGRIIK